MAAEVRAFLAETPPGALNAGLEDGNTRLHAFAEQGALDAACVGLLVAAGVDLGAQNVAGDTALHVCARAGHLEGCEALLRAGASPLLRNARNRTPGGQQRLDPGVRELLEQAEREEKERRQGRRDGLYGAKLQATQTQSAFGVRAL